MTDFDDPWDEFAPTSATFKAWTTPGDEVIGTIVSRGFGEDFLKARVPEIVVQCDDDTMVTVTASLTNLKNQFYAKRDEIVVGNRIRIKFTGLGPAKPGFSPPKLFAIDVKPAVAKPAGKAKKAEAVTVPAAEPETNLDDF